MRSVFWKSEAKESSLRKRCSKQPKSEIEALSLFRQKEGKKEQKRKHCKKSRKSESELRKTNEIEQRPTKVKVKVKVTKKLTKLKKPLTVSIL